MSLAEDLRAFLLDDGPIAALVGSSRIHKNHVPQESAMPYASYFRGGVEYEDATDDAHGEQPMRQFFDIEAVSDDVAEAESLSELIRDRCANYRGDFGASKVQGCFVSDHDDEYIPRNTDNDGGLHVATIRVEVIPR